MDKKLLSPSEVCDYVEGVGIKKTSNRPMQTLFLGILAGAFIALGGFASAVASHSIENFGISKLVAGMVFPVGLMLVLICGAELFTGNNLLSVALFQKKVSLGSVLKNWVIVFFGNAIGAVSISLLLFYSGAIDMNGGHLGAYAIKVAAYKSTLPFGKALLSGILCNIVVCLAVWGAYAAKDVSGRVLMSFFPIMAFVIGGFEHCVANMYYLSLGFLAKGNELFVSLYHGDPSKVSKIDIPHIINNLIPVTIGNIIGGAILIGGIYWFIYMSKDKKVNQNINKSM